MRVPEIFSVAVDLAIAHGAKSIKDLPGCFELEVDEDLAISINGHGVATRCVHGVDVPPWSLYLQHRGWPAAIVDASGGSCVANEDKLIAKIRAALERSAPPAARSEKT